MTNPAFNCIRALALAAPLVFSLTSCGVGGSVRSDAGVRSDSGSGCGAFRVRCAGECIDPRSDNRFCGASGPCGVDTSGASCGADDVCVSGRCVADCPAGQLECANRCVDPLRDGEFCGATDSCTGSTMGTACSAGTVCVAGVCNPNCPTGQIACDGQCIDPFRDREWCGASGSCLASEAGTQCLQGQVCVAGACVTLCPTGQIACEGQCIDPNKDPVHCGASGSCGVGEAGAVCGAGQVCGNGVCQTSCPTGQVACGGRCVDPNTDPEFCGASLDCGVTTRGVTCISGEVCSAGSCTPNCPSGQLFCGGRCIDSESDNTYCGASGSCGSGEVGEVCASGRICVAGSCEVRCVSGQIVCDDMCVDPLNDRNYCGASGACSGPNAGEVCEAGEVCSAGSCSVSCVAGQLECEGRCIDPLSDRVYCGAQGDCSGSNAGSPCDTGEVCMAGVCELSCASGQVACEGRCVDPLTDRNYCGASAGCTGPTAGIICSPGEICRAGSCDLNCTDGQLLCDGRCIDPQSDRTYCGASADCMGAQAGTPCAAGEVCSGGRCALSCGSGLTECVDQCVDLNSNPGFCGGCGTVCPVPANARAVCAAATCGAICEDGFVDCNDNLSADGCEADLTSDAANCGACGLLCPGDINAVASCAARSCGLSCAAGFVDCNRDLGTGGDGCEIQAPSCPLARWTQAFGGTADDRVIRDVKTFSDGSSYVLGQYQTSIPIDGETLSSARFGAYLAKLDAAGTLQWVRNIASTVQDAFAERIVLDSTGNVYVAGHWFRGNLTVGATTVANAGSERGFAAKLDANGAVVWARDLINGQVRGANIVASNLVVTGPFNATENLDSFTLTHSGATSDGYLAVLDATSGTATTAFSFGSDTADEFPNGVAATSTGGFAVAGSYRLGAGSIGGQALPTGAMNNGFVALLNASGTATWAADLSSAANENLWDVVVDSGNHLYVAGHNGAGAYLARHNAADGNRDWSVPVTGGNSFSGSERISLSGANVVSVFQFLGSGTFGSQSLTASTNSGAIVQVRRDTGIVESAQIMTLASPVRFHAVAPLTDGGFLVGASFEGPVTLDGASIPHAGSWDDWVLSLYPR